MHVINVANLQKNIRFSGIFMQIFSLVVFSFPLGRINKFPA